MKGKLIMNGMEYEVEIVEESAKKFEVKLEKNKTGYERVKYDQVFYYDACDGESGADYDQEGDGEIDKMYNAANYYSDEKVAAQNARADKLMRQLRRFSVNSRKTALDWADSNQDKYFIEFDHDEREFNVDSFACSREFGGIYFDSEEAAWSAITTFHDELWWYFIEYKDSL